MGKGKLTCPNCGTVLVGLQAGFHCPDCDQDFDDDEIMPNQGIHQRDKRSTHNLSWRKVTVVEARQERLLDDGA